MTSLRMLLQRLVRRKSSALSPLFVGTLLCALFSLAAPASAKTPMQEYVEAMQPGWNLGNTLDAVPNETAWGSGNASLKIVGPVILKLAGGLTLDGTLGSSDHPEWLELQIASGGVTLNGKATINGNIAAPAGTVTVNGAVHGRVSADRLIINGNGLVEDPAL